MVKDNVKLGLSSEEAEQSAVTHGKNVLPSKNSKSFFMRFLGAFNDPIIKILLASLLINVILHMGKLDPWETLGICTAVLISTLISATSEYSSEKAYTALVSELENTSVTVYRDGVTVSLPPAELVVGDAVLLRPGEKIRADGHLLSGQVRVNQSALNGEGEEAEKSVGRRSAVPELSDKVSLFSGSLVCGGDGIMQVDAVGANTFYGKLAGELSYDQGESPLKEKLRSLAKTVSRYGYISAFLVLLADLFNSLILDKCIYDPASVPACILHAITIALTVVIVAVPEGLPMMIGVVLSRNIRKMRADNVMVRTPVGIETAGGINILFTDKTGTLTEGKMSVSSITDITGRSQRTPPEYIIPHYAISCLLDTSCTESADGITGATSTDVAMYSDCVKYRKYILDTDTLSHTPFSSEKKYSSVTVMCRGKKRTYIKGAADILLSSCTHALQPDGKISPINKKSVSDIIHGLGERSYRNLIISYTENGMNVYICTVSLCDGIRPEAQRSVSSLQSAGIDVVMITGDNEQTACSIARRSGIINRKKDLSITGKELSSMSDEEIKKILPRLAVICRAYPSDKSRMVKICKESGLVVGMTGDGINDSPALKCADVGFAMGSGCDVAKESGDVVIRDDNISSIAKTVLYGRTIFKSIRKFLLFQLTMNFCAVAISMLAPLIGCETPVTVIQMLWINIIMDTLAALAFAGEAPREEYMSEPPITRGEKVLSGKMKSQIAFTGIFCTGIMLWFLTSGRVKEFFGFYHGQTPFYCGFFGLFVFLGIFNCFNTRTHRINLFCRLSKNKSFCIIIASVFTVQLFLMYFGGTVFRCTPLTLHELLFVLLLSALVIPMDILRKILSR